MLRYRFIFKKSIYFSSSGSAGGLTTPMPGNFTSGFDNMTGDDASLERIYTNIRMVKHIYAFIKSDCFYWLKRNIQEVLEKKISVSLAFFSKTP